MTKVHKNKTFLHKKQNNSIKETSTLADDIASRKNAILKKHVPKLEKSKKDSDSTLIINQNDDDNTETESINKKADNPTTANILDNSLDKLTKNLNPVKKERDPLQEEKTVFVGNIPANTKLNQLKNFFSKCTILNCRFRLANGDPILKHKMRKNSESINAWVVFKDLQDVEKAIKFNGTEFKGRHIRVTRSTQKVSNNDKEKKCTIFIGNLKYSANDEKLHGIFSSCGEIEFVRTIKNTKGCVGVAYVCFKKPESVMLALELNKTLLDDRPINVERYSTNKSGASKKNKSIESVTGAEKRIKSKLKNNNQHESNVSSFAKFSKKTENVHGHKLAKSKIANKNMSAQGDNKKSNFRGVKVESKKFKKKNPPRKSLQILATKIAPRD